MIRSFRNAPIRKKIVTIILLTSGLVLAGSSAVFVFNEAVSFRSDALKALDSTADLIGNNSVAAVMFKDQNVAAESIAGLQKNESILAAYLLTGDNEVLASYVSDKAAPGDLPPGMVRCRRPAEGERRDVGIAPQRMSTPGISMPSMRYRPS